MGSSDEEGNQGEKKPDRIPGIFFLRFSRRKVGRKEGRREGKGGRKEGIREAGDTEDATFVALVIFLTRFGSHRDIS